MKELMLTKAMMTALAVCTVASTALADDFKTVNGKEYKNATVSRIEPDGVVLKYKSGISKIYFTELPKEVQERFHYDPVRGAVSNVAVQATIAQSNANVQQEMTAKEKATTVQLEKTRSAAQPVMSQIKAVFPSSNAARHDFFPTH